jgi:hypothetical protein
MADEPTDHKTNDNDTDHDDIDESLSIKYATLSQLTNATTVVVPPPTFAKFMLRKSVNRLNSEARTHVCHVFNRM